MIHLIRHGESEANLRHVFAGQRDDSPLTPLGEDQARETATNLKKGGLTVDRIVSSPLLRAQQTARIIAKEIGYVGEIIIEPLVTEYDMGTMTGTPTHKINSIEMISAPEAEDPFKFHDRVEAALIKWNRVKGGTLLVCHAGVGRMAQVLRTNGDPRLFYDFPPPANASVMEIDWLK